MKIAVVTKPGADFEIQERDIPQPGPGHVRIRVQACGICHSDSLVKEGYWPGIQYPRVPGHEVAGVIDTSALALPAGKKASASASAGTAARTALASRAVAEISPIAAT